MTDEILKRIPPRMKFVLFPNNDVTDERIVKSTVRLVDAFSTDETHIPS